MSKPMPAAAIEAAKAWHASPEGLEWHRQHGHRTYAALPTQDLTCVGCGEHFTTRTVHHNTRYCSHACQARHHRKQRRTRVVDLHE